VLGDAFGQGLGALSGKTCSAGQGGLPTSHFEHMVYRASGANLGDHGMDFEPSQFREAIKNPKRFVELALLPGKPQEGGNPQRPWFEACARRYFRDGRSPESAFKHLERCVSRSKSSMRFANASAVREMLTCFLAWDLPEGVPEAYFPDGASPALVGAHRVALSPSLRYSTRDGILIRHVWTEGAFSVRRPYSRVVAAGFLAHAESTFGERSVQQVEFWHVRSRRVAAWRADDLRGAIPGVIALLDQIASRLAGPSTPGAAA
jgi:hypothetical protein